MTSEQFEIVMTAMADKIKEQNDTIKTLETQLFLKDCDLKDANKELEELRKRNQ